MQRVKRIEIIIDSPELPEMIAILRSCGVTDYTVFSPLTGSGDRGERRNDEPGGGAGNACLLTALPPDQCDRLIEAVRPVLQRRGGICLVTDAEWVKH